MGDHDHGIYTGRTLISASERLCGSESTALTFGEHDTHGQRCIPLFASVVRCAARTPNTVCVRVQVRGFSRVCPMGHTVLPTASTVFRHFVGKCLPS